MKSLRILITALLISGLHQTALANPTSLPKTQIGINGHSMFSSGIYRQISDEALFAYLKSRSIKNYRLSVILANDTDPWSKTRFRSLVNLAKKYGVSLQPAILLPYSWGDKTDFGRYPAGDSTALYNQGYRRTLEFVSDFAADVKVWELQNEVNLQARDAAGNIMFGKGWKASEFSSQQIMRNYASLLKGMSDAIDRVNQTQTVKLRRIVGTTSTMFGYIDFIKSQGVKVDILGYHYYERWGVDPYNYWGGVNPTYNLFQKLASYGVPVHVNEINCAEIYDAFVNVTGSSTMNRCAQNLESLLKTFTSQRVANIEMLSVYELLDQPNQTGPESRFGILYNMTSEKPMAAIVASYAKSSLTAPAPTPTPTPTPTTPVSGVPDIVFPGQVEIRNRVAASIKPVLKIFQHPLIAKH